MTKAPATANELTSIPMSFRISSPDKQKRNHNTGGNNGGLPRLYMPYFAAQTDNNWDTSQNINHRKKYHAGRNDLSKI